MRLPDGTEVAERRLRIGGLALNLVEAGPPSGPPLILLHGFPEFWWGWRHQIGPLARAGMRVVVPDQRGYNLSDKPDGIEPYRLPQLGRDVAGLADALGLDRVDLAGHDWGGIVAWWTAARHPHRVRRLAILNAPHPDTTWRVLRADPAQALRSWYVAAFQVPGLPERLLAAGDFRALARALTGSGRAGTFSREDLARYRQAWSQPGAVSAMLAWYRALIRRPPPRAGRVHAPTLLLWGKKDVALGPRFASESLTFCEDGRLLWFEDASHWVQHEEPAEVNAALLAHFAGPEVSRPDGARPQPPGTP